MVVPRRGRAATRPSAACYCYILQCSDGTFYTGWTTNPERRVKRHNAGQGSRYTRARRPVRLVLLEFQADRTVAMRRERAIKAMKRSSKLRLIGEFSRPGKGRKMVVGKGTEKQRRGRDRAPSR